VLRWGAHSEEVIDVYSAIEHQPPGSFKVNPAYTVDAVVARLEAVVVREYESTGIEIQFTNQLDPSPKSPPAVLVRLFFDANQCVTFRLCFDGADRFAIDEQEIISFVATFE
jgi:hypothetical protein